MLDNVKPDFEVHQVSDYCHVVCGLCHEACELDFSGYNGAVPEIEITCPKCGSTGKRKLFKGGLGFGRDGQKSRWQQFGISEPPDGVRLMLKMADDRQNISYGIGIVDHRDGELKVLAQDDKKASSPMLWMVIPD